MDSIISINVAQESNRSVLKDSFHNAPYKLVHYGARNSYDHLELIIMSASPGVMDGDTLTIHVNLQANTQLKLYTQAFNKLHPMIEGAQQHMDVIVEEEGLFQYIPHPTTPFKGSIYKTITNIHLQKHATLIWGDIICGGRIHMNESFAFSRLHSLTKVFFADGLRYFDNQYLAPKEQPIKKMLFLEGYTHQGTLLYASPYADELKLELDEILKAEYEEITYGFTSCADDMVMIRILGNDGELLYNFMTMLGQLCWDFTQHKITEKSEKPQEPISIPAGQIKKSPAQKKTIKKTRHKENKAAALKIDAYA
ncbi:urease accessory protein UreD [Olivibacter sp. SDN3]|uniref:urease accessory protein UreD n=1 Tax=Olivibacter sp. SDN3 TaxID=2764720 RepID=UPI001651185B|nr:urease accessory protein UreD [Olivibacter sp. SDN3]QNL50876.1 urease accessory protein UreD [Olivibacter sp. SDN3]